MGHAFGSVEELGEGYGFRKIRVPLGVTAFGVNAIVYPPGFEGFHHYHDTQDELYFVHSGSARFEVRPSREGDVLERWNARAGSVTLMRAPGLAGVRDGRPYHAVHGPPRGTRCSLALRMRVDPSSS